MASRLVKYGAITAAALLALPSVGVGVFLATLDIESYRPRILAAAQAATGRSVSFGAMRLSLGLTPGITVSDARLGNLPGGSRPDMVTVGEAEIDVAILPLITGRLAVRRLLLKAPDILLEVVNGEPNWRFSPAVPPAASAAPAAPRAQRTTTVELGIVEIRDARLSFPGAPAGGVTLARLDASGAGNFAMRGNLNWGATPLTFDAEGGPLARIFGAPGPAWPLRLRAEVAGARLQAQGEVREPRGLLGYRLDITADVPTLAALAPLTGPLPPLTNITLRGRVVGDGFALPRPEALTASLGAATLAPGLELARATISMPALDQVARLELAGSQGGQPFSAAGTAGPLASGALPLDVSGQAMGLAFSARGQVAEAMAGTGMALAVTLRSDSLGQIAAQLSERGAFFADGVNLAGIVLQGPVATGGGDLVLRRTPVPGVSGRLALTRLDIDAAMPTPAPAAPAPAVPAARAPAAPSAPPPAADRRLIPAIPLDFTALGRAAADLTFTIATLRAGGRDYDRVEGHLLLADGRARLDPVALTPPGGRVTLRVAADGAGPLPQMQVSARSDAVDIAALLGGFGIATPLTGRGEVDLDLRGQGADTRAWAAGAVGHLGLAVTEGRIAGSVVRAALPAQAQSLAPEIGIACLAARFDVVAGIAQARALFVDSTLGRATGGGQVSLRDETLALRLNTDLRLPVPGTPGLRVRAPLPVSGTLAAPRFDGSGLVGSAVAGQADRILPGLGAALGGGGGGAAMSDCGTALAAARGGRAGPVPASQAPAVEPPQATPTPRPQVQDVLRGLLGR